MECWSRTLLRAMKASVQGGFGIDVVHAYVGSWGWGAELGWQQRADGGEGDGLAWVACHSTREHR